jgi:peptidoglycan/LPS O-acetylase OafA/YrhL
VIVRSDAIRQDTSERLAYVDGLRALAAGAVLVGHYCRAYGLPPLIPLVVWKTPLWSVQDGFAAVALFFVLSGLVLSLKYFEGRGEPVYSYVPKRLVRLGLPFLFALWSTSALHAIVGHPYATVPAPSPWILEFWKTSVGALRQSFLFMQIGTPRRLLPQDWSLTVELNVSLWVPLLAPLALRSPVILALVAIVSVAFLGVHALLLPFVAGVVLARFWSQIGTISDHRGLVASAMIVGLLLYSSRGILGASSVASHITDRGIWLLTDAGAVLLFIGVSGSHLGRRWLSSRTLAHLGRISYNIFLWHFPVLMYGTPLVLRLLIGRSGDALAWYVGLATTLAGTLIISELSYRFIEQPAIVFARRMTDGPMPVFLPRPRRAR